MASSTKDITAKEDTFDKLDIRVGKVLTVENAENVPKKSYKLTVDFGKYGIKTSVGRFTQHSPEDLLNQLVLGVLNFASRQMGDTLSEVLVLGVQLRGAESGEATLITPKELNVKLGSKLF